MTRDLFWFVAGLLTAIAALIVAIPLFRSQRDEAGPRLRPRVWIAAALVLVLAAAVVGLYSWLGTPSAIGTGGAGMAGTGEAPHPAEPGAGAGTALSMEDATARLAARLDAGGGTRADWELLAQSYDFLGRPQEAAAARERAAASPDGGIAGAPAAAAPSLAAADRAELDKANALRSQQDYKGAAAIYAALAARGAMTADSWADYADVAASLNDGKLAGEPARFIEEALRQDPRHAKALWLKASLAYQEKRYKDAVAGWSALLASLPEGSPDRATVEANLEESARLAGVPVPAAAPAAKTARIAGTVELGAKVRDRAAAGATLFIYAKEPGAAGPPLAVVRVAAEGWPVSFTLDDSSAMIPGRDLSHAGTVQVEARISRSGNAIAQPGDLIGTLGPVDPRAGKPVRITIDRVL